MKISIKQLSSIASVFLLSFSFLNSATANSNTDKLIHKTDSKLHYTLTIKYPLYTDTTFKKLNQEINEYIHKSMSQFIANLEKDAHPISGLPLNESSNTLTISYKTIMESPRYVSLLFTQDTFFYGAAHPNTSFFSINFASTPPHIITLESLFKAHVNYLNFFKTYATPIITEQLNQEANAAPDEKIKPFEEGLKATPSNYEVWNIAPNGLMITFPAYQVAPYVFGAQHIVIPYKQLKGLLKNDVLG